MSYVLPSLPYSYNALEPFFDEETMKIHHTKHHQNYINNTNSILENTTFSSLPIEELISILNEIILEKKNALRNNAGGHINHSFFWKSLKSGTVLTNDLKIEIEKQFGTIDEFKEKFESVALNHFGSGWVWLVNQNGVLSIVSTVNQDSPLMGKLISNTYGYPIIGLDIWEHAYYLKYQNRRLDYIKSFWNVVNWEEASNRLQK
ncbi:Fe-Mn family superoxide dismutase [Buchnera aphidicola str. APS (Acyrthosiphon pisum)]|uniref:Superoxide dismutase [Mn] n=2 Tax=Buchnera aphidicola TaxID=9 RepID=SODM_BUCAI|nr:Fe-Mn family superoxide dismutase [Buchnera aphidicola]P57286.1 RecName: Full=Superoxide dismutase [Mn] [Buchnera aphidicola str. APS (Acyrthosiphon pisum)]pir/B84952/ superoxide dismutase (EC 1.15.1.1) [imported] - Buchnera sp. (strain APS) [Buchnera sp. (in: enterobacteria)]ADP66583.1 superoxide dismutase [Buchnera aphidicola str. TLW03 (Acyrthosiphon pisum)]ADP67715.1 superoxide dismutase [Buchnera aphidicola str. JF98 (Acyrthosiphon pisum)]OQX99586.1 MAG: superoxide dismutase [Mn] [Erwi